MDSQREGIKALAREAALLPKEELLQVKAGSSDLVIGIPKENLFQEKRICLTPDAAAAKIAAPVGKNTLTNDSTPIG